VVSRAPAFLALSVWCLVRPAAAQLNYQNFTFTTLAGQATGWFDGVGPDAQFNSPFGVAVDANGNLYVADTGNSTVRKVTPAGVVTTLAGLAGIQGATNGAGQQARFYYPGSVAVDPGGNVYVADSSNDTIRKITPDGVTTTLAGSAGVTNSTDGPGASARFNSPQGLAIDVSGNLYVADSGNSTIRKVTPAGVVSTLAGKAGVTGTNDASSAAAARFNVPYGVAVDTNGNIYVGDTENHTIRKISPTGAVTTLAGTPGTSGSTDGTNSGALFKYPCGVGVDGSGNIYVADYGNDTIRQVSTNGVVTTLAGSAGTPGSTNGTGHGALFYSPLGLAVDGNGNVYVADSENAMIRRITTPAAAVTTVAGSSSAPGSANGAGSTARFNDPCGVAVDSSGTVYVSDLGNNTIRQITPQGVVTTLAGLAGSFGTNDGTGAAARFGNPAGLAVDTNDNLYVAEYGNHTIRKIAPGGIVTTLAGEPGVGGSSDGTGSAAHFLNPLGVAVDAAGNVYVADTLNNTIRKITPDGTVSTLAGVVGTAGAKDGPGATARFDYPQGLAVDPAGNVYVADTSNSTIRKITPDGMVSTLAGMAQMEGACDGSSAAARFDSPFTLAADSQGYLYVVDTSNNTIRKVSPAGVVTTLAGLAGQAGDADGTGPEASFNDPEGIAVDANGNLYVANTQSSTIRKGNPALPDAPVVNDPFGPPGTLRQFGVTNLSVTNWSWTILRFPSDSAAQLSSTTALNPTLTPDVPDLFVIRFQGQDSLGRAALGTLWIANDLTPPTLGITQPQPSQTAASSPLYVSGTASDDVHVASVWCQLNGGPWVQAAGTFHWAAILPLTNPGANTLSAYAVDGSGKVSSPTNTVRFLYTPDVTVQVSGEGTVSPNYQGKSLVIGKTYTITATPLAGSGYLFAAWIDKSGNVLATTPTYTFTMTNGLTLIASFVVNPFQPLQGTYAGLFIDTNSLSAANAGSFSATLTSLGALSAQLQVAGSAYRFSGSLSVAGAYSNSVSGPAGKPITLQLQLDLSGVQGMTGSVSTATWSAGLAACQALASTIKYATAYPTNAISNLVALAGKSYTLVMVPPLPAEPAAAPAGYGFGTLSVSSSGGVTFSGALGDGTKVTASSAVVGSGQWPLCLAPSAYAGNGMACGWLRFATNGAGPQPVGWLSWLKGAGVPRTLYPNGFAFTNAVQVLESRYSYTSGSRLLDWTNGVIELADGNLSVPGLTNGVTLGLNNKVSGTTNNLSVTLTTASGLFQGTVPLAGSKTGVSVSGVLLQDDNAGYGLFLGPSESGSVYLGQP